MDKGVIVGFGEALIDIFHRREVIGIFPDLEVIGGAPLNFAVRAAELGSPLGYQAAMLTRLGKDDRGQRVKNRLAEANVNRRCVQFDDQLPTGTVDVEIVKGEPSYKINSPAAWDEIEWDDRAQSLADATTAICFGTLAQRSERAAATLRSFLKCATRAVKVLDLNLRLPWPSLAVVTWSLQHAALLKCNADELRLLGQWYLQTNLSAREIADRLQAEFALRAIFWTQGEEGCCWQADGNLVTGKVPQLPQAPDADPVGAGDAASAALVLGLVESWPPTRIIEAANWCGAYAASQRGATTPLSDEVLRHVLGGGPQ